MTVPAMVISLASRERKLIFFGAVLLAAAYFAGKTVRIVLAQTWGESSDPGRVARAAAMDPDNPELHYGMAALNLLQPSNVSLAVAELRRAITLNPWPAKYWLALGQACFVLDDQACAGDAFERASRQAPMMPRLEWAALSYYAAIGDGDQISSHAKRLLELSPQDAKSVFEAVARAGRNDESLWLRLADGGSQASVKCAYLDFLAESGRFDLAARYWKQASFGLGPRNLQPRFPDVKPYLQRLLDAGRYADAATVWHDLLRMGVVEAGDWRPSGNLIFNGGFEAPILNAGFDWQISNSRYVVVDSISEQASDQGKQVLRVQFTVPHNAEDEPAFQLVPVQGGRRYELTARIRTEAVTSDSGPRIRVRDARCPSCLNTATETTVGTTGWHQVSVEFFTPPRTQAVRVSLWRARSRVFPMDVTGTAWLDQVALRPMGEFLEDASIAPAQSAPVQ